MCCLAMWLCMMGFVHAQKLNLQVADTLPTAMIEAFKIGNSRLLMPWLSDRIRVTLNGRSRLYMPKKARVVLKNFFKNNPPIEFTLIHQGVSKGKKKKRSGALLYYIASYRSQTMYHMHMLVRRIRGRYHIRRISFDKQ